MTNHHLCQSLLCRLSNIISETSRPRHTSHMPAQSQDIKSVGAKHYSEGEDDSECKCRSKVSVPSLTLKGFIVYLKIKIVFIASTILMKIGIQYKLSYPVLVSCLIQGD